MVLEILAKEIIVTTVKEVVVPDIGNATDVDVIEISVKPGDTVKAEQS